MGNVTKNFHHEINDTSNGTTLLLQETKNPSSGTKKLLRETNNPNKISFGRQIILAMRKKTSCRRQTIPAFLSVAPDSEADTYSDNV